MDIIDPTVFGRVSHFTLAVEGIHLWQDDEHTANADSLRLTVVTVIQQETWCSSTGVGPSG